MPKKRRVFKGKTKAHKSGVTDYREYSHFLPKPPIFN